MYGVKILKLAHRLKFKDKPIFEKQRYLTVIFIRTTNLDSTFKITKHLSLIKVCIHMVDKKSFQSNENRPLVNSPRYTANKFKHVWGVGGLCYMVRSKVEQVWNVWGRPCIVTVGGRAWVGVPKLPDQWHYGTPSPWTDRQPQLKTLPSRNFVGGR